MHHSTSKKTLLSVNLRNILSFLSLNLTSCFTP